MRNKEEVKTVLANLKKVQNIIFWSALAQIGLGFLNAWLYKVSDYHIIWLFIIASNIYFAVKSLLQYHRGHNIAWELENEINKG